MAATAAVSSAVQALLRGRSMPVLRQLCQAQGITTSAFVEKTDYVDALSGPLAKDKARFGALSTGELRRLCAARGISSSSFLEKSEFVDALLLSAPHNQSPTTITIGAAGATTTTTSSSTIIARRLKRILGQDRGVVDYRDYKVCTEHQERVRNLPARLRIPRDKWFRRNKLWSRHSRGPMMPMYHVHFREESQEVLKLLFLAYRAAATPAAVDTTTASTAAKRNQQKKTAKMLRQAFRTFQGSMRGLAGHVGIEESHYFGQFQSRFADVDLSFLYSDHKVLHESEAQVHALFRDLLEEDDDDDAAEGGGMSTAAVLGLITAYLGFDEQLINHLGEEEEIIVPMELQR